MLKIEDLCLKYGNQVLFQHFNLHLTPGQMGGITGESGCGKTSLLNAILGFTPIESGTISVAGIPVQRNNLDAIRRQIAWIPQELALPLEWVKEMIQLPFELKANKHIPFNEDTLMRCFDQLGLERSLYSKRVVEISGGQRQRMMIAVAAMLQKTITIVDEPTSALDIGATNKVVDFFKQITQRGGTVLAVSHDKNFVQQCHLQVEIKNNLLANTR